APAQAGSTTCSATGIGSLGACSLDTGSIDTQGAMLLSPSGAGLSSLGTATITFSIPLGTNNPACIFNLSDVGSVAWNPRATVIPQASSTSAQTVNWDNNGVNLGITPGSMYRIAYQCSPT